MRSVAEIIEALGGTGAVARTLGLPESTVSSWKGRHSIPGEHWAALEDMAKATSVDGVTAAGLASLHDRRASVEARV